MSKSKTMSPRKRGREFWIEQLRASERSGLSLHAFAQSQGLNAHTAYQWRKRLGGESRSAATQRWARVQVEPAQRSGARYRVQLPNGIAVEISGTLDEDELGRVLRVVAGR